mgnify:CR=1 FL=1
MAAEQTGKNRTTVTYQRGTKTITVINDKPSMRTYDSEGNLRRLRWKTDGEFVIRDNDLPNEERYFKNGNLFLQAWHDSNKTFFKVYYPDGRLKEEHLGTNCGCFIKQY